MSFVEASPAVRTRLSRATLRRAMLTAVVLAFLALAAVPVHEELYTAIARAIEASPLAALAGVIAEKGPLVLVATFAVLAVRSWLRDRRALRIMVAGGAGAVVAYLTSELVKLVITEPRPCRAFDVTTVLECPEVGDWSWPSNHSVIAASLATACVLAVPRIIWFVAPVAVLLGFSRVAGGVHYVHDVLSGFALGVLVVTGITVALLPLVDRLYLRLPDRFERTD
ncbi:phosphatase PAP2 family protein [Rhodococcus sp. 105337]|uniref:phosphatase PAP2 family protein n=1 Tax=unclassified Rhodococcus (in: high G+C Gram-positive bacteria) TaxID=192944 RepID=UPI001F0D4DB6|nr:phosphatase PAP2 family protein [Rhodococcus sp. 105337]